MYAFPQIGKLPVAMIDTPLVLKVIDPIWKSKPDTANRVRGRERKCFGLGDGARLADWRQSGALGRPPLRGATRQDRGDEAPHRPALRRGARVRRATRGQTGVHSKALEFLILTAARSGEVLGARWSEIDLDKQLWVIPADRMKEKREHRVPLIDRAISILKELPREGHFVFIGARKG